MKLVPSGHNKYDPCPRGIICRRAIYIQFPHISWSVLIWDVTSQISFLNYYNLNLCIMWLHAYDLIYMSLIVIWSYIVSLCMHVYQYNMPWWLNMTIYLMVILWIYICMCTDNYLSWKNVFTGESSHNKLGISLFGRYFEDNYYYLEDRIIKLN